MGAGDVVAIVLISLIIGAASFYLIKAKKNGKKCIGCPYADSCSSKCTCCSSENEKSNGKKT